MAVFKPISYIMLFTILLLVLSFACNKDDDDDYVEGPDQYLPYFTGSMYSFHDAYAWEAQMITDSLIGEWEWVTMVCVVHPIDAFCDSLPEFRKRKNE